MRHSERNPYTEVGDVVLLWLSQVLDGWLQRCKQREKLPSSSRNVGALGKKPRKSIHYFSYISVRNLPVIRVHIPNKEMRIFQKVVNYFSSFSAVLRGRFLYPPHREMQPGKLDCDFSLKETWIIGRCSGVVFCYLHLKWKYFSSVVLLEVLQAEQLGINFHKILPWSWSSLL